MRRKLNDLFIYHSNLDSRDTIKLLIAFEHGNLKQISAYLNVKNVNQSIGVCGFLPLELSIIYDHKHVFDYIVHQLNANLNIKNKSFETMPFIALAFQRQSYLFSLLNLDMSCLYDCTNDTQRTLMHQAAISGDTEIVRRLLEDFGFYKNLNEYELQHLLYDKYDCTPLYYACWFGCVEIVDLLLNACFDKSNDFSVTRLNVLKHNKKNSYLKKSNTSDDITDLESLPNIDNCDDEVFILSSSMFEHEAHEEEKQLPWKAKKNFKFKDSSLAISILYNRFDCAKMLLTRSIETSCIQEVKNLNDSSYSTELDSWFAASMKLHTCSEFNEMSNLFHELSLNGAKFSNYLFILIDSMGELSQFKHSFLKPPQIIEHRLSLTNVEIDNYTFCYNSFFSNFFKCLTFICNYNLGKLFSSDQKMELFLKSLFVKINELFLVTNNWHMVDLILLNNHSTCGKNPLFSASYEYFRHNHDALEWFIFDLEQFLKSLYSNGHTFKYFSKKTFFNFLRKRKFIYYLIETCLYNEASNITVFNQANRNKKHGLSLSDYTIDNEPKYLNYMQAKAICSKKRDSQSFVKPLSLVNLTKCTIKRNIRYLDRQMIKKLELPCQMKLYLEAELAVGLSNSHGRAAMNNTFKSSTLDIKCP